jgi:hypothetical protein
LETAAARGRHGRDGVLRGQRRSLRPGYAVAYDLLVRVGVLGLLAAGAAVVAAAALASTAPAPLGALRNLAPPARLPGDYVRLVELSASHVGVSRAVAVRRTRMLLRDVTGLPLYAFWGTQGRVCFAVWRGAGTCGIVRRDSVLWLVNGGSRKRGQAVVGVAADGVHAVDVAIGATTIRASVRHNAFVVPFRIRKGGRTPQPHVTPVR